MKKVLITGASGFVGQHLISALESKYQLFGLSTTQSNKKDGQVNYFFGDLLDSLFVEQVLEKVQPDAIVNLAGIAQTHHVEAELLFKVNFFGVYNLLEAVKKKKNLDGFSPKILHISSSDVYGKTNTPESISEESVLNPINNYGVSKLGGDRLAYQYSQSEKLNIIIFRPFPHMGPGQKIGFFVPDIASQIVEIENQVESSEIKVGNLNAVRDYLDVRDVVRAYALGIEKNLEPGQTFNLCSGKGIKITDILNKMISLANKKIKVVEDPERMRASEVPVLIGNNSKVKQALGWDVEIDLDQTLQETINFWRNIR